MVYRILADVVVIFHFAFILFVVFGSLLVLKWRRVAWAHLPVVAYGALIEFYGWICPLTPFEKWLRVTGGGTGYDASFTEHYILPIIYPAGLTRTLQITLGVTVIVINAAVYGWILYRSMRSTRKQPDNTHQR